MSLKWLVFSICNITYVNRMNYSSKKTLFKPHNFVREICSICSELLRDDSRWQHHDDYSGVLVCADGKALGSQDVDLSLQWW